VLAALKVKSTGRLGLITVKVAVTGLNVPGVKAGIFTTAFVGVPTTVKDCNPVPALT
jgi:superfamily II DNA or RNA helicase